VLFEAVAEGRLHLAAVSRLASHVTPENVRELIEAAAHRKKSDYRRDARTTLRDSERGEPGECSTRIRPLPATTSTAQLAQAS